MAQTFKNAKAVLAGTATNIYTCPAATTAIVIGAQAVNVGSATSDLTMYWTDSSDSSATTYLAQAIPVPDAAGYEPLNGKLVLEAGDSLVAFSSTASALEATVSVLEIS
jgi:hypothetical protein